MDDSFYYALNPSAMPQGHGKAPAPKHKRKQSLLEKPTPDVSFLVLGPLTSSDSMYRAEPLTVVD